VAANPALVVGVLGMATIRQTLEKLSGAVGTADILGWSCSSAVDTSRRARGGFDDEKPLELDKLMPVVAEIVDVDEADLFAAAEVESRLLRSSRWR
jgi:hypothetical protein